MGTNVKFVGVADFQSDFGPQIKKLMESVGGQAINFYTMDKDQLLFIAKHRVLPPYTILGLIKDKVVLRLAETIPTEIQLRQLADKAENG